MTIAPDAAAETAREMTETFDAINSATTASGIVEVEADNLKSLQATAVSDLDSSCIRDNDDDGILSSMSMSTDSHQDLLRLRTSSVVGKLCLVLPDHLAR